MKPQFMRSLSLVFLLLLTCVRASVARDLQTTQDLEGLPAHALAHDVLYADAGSGDDQFGNVVRNQGDSKDNTQIDRGTPDKDLFIQYGFGGNDTQYTSGAAGNDWLEQYGGFGDDKQTSVADSGEDVISQDGGLGNDTQAADGGSSNDKIYQDGGLGDDDLHAEGGPGDDYIQQNSGFGNDTIRVGGGDGNDSIRIDAGFGNDTIIYDVYYGNDKVLIDGGFGEDKVTINAGTNQNFTIKNKKGEVVYQQGTGGTVITVQNVECIQVIAADGRVLFERCGYKPGMPGAFVARLDASGTREAEILQPRSEGMSAVIMVNTLVDENDGSCNDGDCSLRDAIQVASPGGTIRFSVSGFIVLDLGALTINKNLTIEGPASEFLGISAASSSRVLSVGSGANVTLSDIEISDGVSDYGGGIYNLGNLTVNNCAIRGNTATTSGGGVYNAANGVLTVTTTIIADNGAALNGGGIDNQGTLTIVGSEIRANGTESGNGGGIYNQGTLTINGSTIAGNDAAAYGGGIYNTAGRTATITRCEIGDNGAASGGGGVDNRGVLSITHSEIRDNGAEAGGGGGILNLHTLTVNSSTFAGNESTTYGGGIYVSAATQTTVTNSTLHDNVSSRGGGIAITSASITVTNVTLFRNEAVEGGGIYSSGTPSQTALRNTVVAGSPAGGDCGGAMATTSTHNLATDGSCSPGFTQVTTATLKLVWQGEWLGLESGSVAIDTGSNGVCPATDQRGVTRPRDGNGDGIAICDVGAYEFVAYRIYLPLVLRNAP